MKLVIDIPDEDYEFIKDLNAVMGGRVSCKTIQYNVINAIKKGTPVQTGEWIDRSGNTTYPFWLRYECSICHGHSGMADYCYHCGAKMKGGGEEE